jgi:hypothetical protein
LLGAAASRLDGRERLLGWQGWPDVQLLLRHVESALK